MSQLKKYTNHTKWNDKNINLAMNFDDFERWYIFHILRKYKKFQNYMICHINFVAQKASYKSKNIFDQLSNVWECSSGYTRYFD